MCCGHGSKVHLRGLASQDCIRLESGEYVSNYIACALDMMNVRGVLGNIVKVPSLSW